MQISALVLTALLAVSGPPSKPVEKAVQVNLCLLSLTDQGESKVSIKEGGILKKWAVVAGQEVKAGQLLAQLDDTEAQLTSQGAEAELNVANEEAKSTVNTRYARAAALVAKSEYQQGIDANKRVPGTVAVSELTRLKLTWDRSELEIEKADSDHIIDGLKAKVAEAKADTAKEKVKSHKIISPLDGIVVELNRHVGEWVQPGDALVHIVGLEQLRVEGFVKAADADPRELINQPVSVVVHLAHGKEQTCAGQVVFVSPLINAGHEFRVWVQVTNQKVDGHWLLRPGLVVDMSIPLK
jgi:multidrug efflux pump subunit AcrA (membrane-fusion protein)